MPPSVRGTASSVWQAYCINSINSRENGVDKVILAAEQLGCAGILLMPGCCTLCFTPRPELLSNATWLPPAELWSARRQLVRTRRGIKVVKVFTRLLPAAHDKHLSRNCTRVRLAPAHQPRLARTRTKLYP